MSEPILVSVYPDELRALHRAYRLFQMLAKDSETFSAHADRLGDLAWRAVEAESCSGTTGQGSIEPTAPQTLPNLSGRAGSAAERGGVEPDGSSPAPTTPPKGHAA